MNVLHWEEVFEKTVCQPRLVLDALVQTTKDAKAADNSLMAASVHLHSACKQMHASMVHMLV